MYSVALFALACLAGSASAIIANFDQPKINLTNYQSASFPDFSIVSQDYKTTTGSNTGIIANTPDYYVKSKDEGYGSLYPTNGSLAFTQTKSGHLNSYYFACYSLGTFVPLPDKCNFTMTATCTDRNGKKATLSLFTQYLRDDRKMTYQDLTSFYKYYANAGVLSGTGASAACTRYDFKSINADPSGTQGVGFFVDTMNYSVSN